MIRKSIVIILNFLLNNDVVVRIRIRKIRKINFDNFNFLNLSFDNNEGLKKIIFSKKYFSKKFYDEKNTNYHTFAWLNTAKKIGGEKIISLSKKHIINWYKKKYSSYSFVWSETLISKRLLNFVYNYDFYATSATEKEKDILKFIILKNYLVLKLKMIFIKNKHEQPIEICKTLLLLNLINNVQTNKITRQINEQINYQVNDVGLHKSVNPSAHAEFINELYEIKNICLFFKINVPKVIEYQIMNMSSVLKNLFHKDNTIALFNGSNNANYEQLIKINNLYKDIKPKNLSEVENGVAIFDSKKLKIIFDITKPSSKLLSNNLHSGTLSFEMSYDKEKIVTNCGSIEKRVGRKPEYLRLSAAHSTIIVNNTNVSELVEKKSYKRIPKNITFSKQEDDGKIYWESSHDGYKDNFKKIVKRKLTISKNNSMIIGRDSIISIGLNRNKILYNIRFHLTPKCSCLLTNNKRSVLIKTELNNSWIFTSESKLSLEDSIYIYDGKRISKTKQIVISGLAYSPRNIENWSISKLN